VIEFAVLLTLALWVYTCGLFGTLELLEILQPIVNITPRGDKIAICVIWPILAILLVFLIVLLGWGSLLHKSLR